jgi:hypothetical protein
MGAGISRHDQNRDPLAFDQRHNPKKFVCVATITKNKNQVFSGNHTQVSMSGVHWIQRD